MIRLAPLVLVLSCMLVPAMGWASCDLSTAPALIDASAQAWLEAMPAEISEPLDRDGFAFPKENAIGDCPGMIPALVIFDRPVDSVFSLLIQTERHAEFMSSLQAVVPVSRQPEDHVDRHELKILFRRIAYHVRHHWDREARRIWWDLSPEHDNDLRGILGFWELHPLGSDRSLALYGTQVDVGPIIPRRMQASLTRKNLRTAVENVRHWVMREGGTGR